MLRLGTHRSLGHIEPCLPSPAKRPPVGANWIHEIKHDGFRIMARRDGASVRLLTRHGNDFTSRFPLAAAAVAALPGRSFLIDGEAIVTDDDGLAVFELIRRARHGGAAVPASSAVRASFRSGLAHPTALGGPRNGGRSKIRKRPRSRERLKDWGR